MMAWFIARHLALRFSTDEILKSVALWFLVGKRINFEKLPFLLLMWLEYIFGYNYN